jgi:hypothetical protein
LTTQKALLVTKYSGFSCKLEKQIVHKMRDLRHIRISKIKDSVTFEYLCKEIIESLGFYEQVQFNGRPGQPQNGVDIFARRKSISEWIGIQCKVRENDISEKDIIDELQKAKGFNPKLSLYQIYTTSSRDTKIQKLIRVKYDDLLENFGVKVEIVFWEDIEDILKEERCFRVFHRYFKEFFANNETLGHGIGKVISLDLGVGESTDSHYELMIGKIPTEQTNDYYGVNYYKGCYFLINFLERKMETFPIPCFPSDLEQCFSNNFDRFRISSWINSIKDINDFIYSNESSIQSYISKEKYKEFLDGNNEN